MNSSWRQSRKIAFIFVIIIIISGLLAYKIYPYFNKPATCFDSKQNGDERGVDCGGSCKLICTTDVIPLDVKYAKAVSSDIGLYDIAALIENRNKDKDTSDGSIDYAFLIYDKSGSIIKTISGSTTLPLGQSFPVVIQNVPIALSAGNSITNVVLNISNNKPWQAQDSTYANSFFKVANIDFKRNFNNISQLKVSVTNLTKAYFRNVPVSVLVFDSNHNLIATNETILKEVQAGESKDVVFTWRSPLSIDNPKIEVYPVVTPYTYIK
jgi:hypothetical protein